jgi:hypothetical protein
MKVGDRVLTHLSNQTSEIGIIRSKSMPPWDWYVEIVGVESAMGPTVEPYREDELSLTEN